MNLPLKNLRGKGGKWGGKWAIFKSGKSGDVLATFILKGLSVGKLKEIYVDMYIGFKRSTLKVSINKVKMKSKHEEA